MLLGLVGTVRCHYRGLLSVFGAFVIQLTVGTYHGTFGNMLPYFSSYVRQVHPSIRHGDLAMVFSTGGLAQGVSFMLGGLVFVPVLGRRGCLIFGCLVFTVAPLLTYFTLNTNIAGITFSYGILGASAVNIIMVPTLLIPVTWFPNHKGKVIGFITSGFGFSSTLFAPLQTVIINPSNISPIPEEKTNSSSSYFESEEVLNNIPVALLYLGCVYAVLFVVGVLLTVEKPRDTKDDIDLTLSERLREAFSYLFHQTFTRLDFYLLWLTRLLFLVVGAGILAHWKTFSFTQSSNDKLVSVAGSVNGIMNCLSRVVAGALLDRFRFSRLMPVIASLLTVILLSIYFIAKTSFIGLIICTWLVYALDFSHFSTVPAQTINLFPGVHSSVVVGTVGLSDSFSYAALGIINKLIMSKDDDPRMFLWFFMTLATCSFLAIIVTSFVSFEKPVKVDEKSIEFETKSC